jgi:hypothetical protein
LLILIDDARGELARRREMLERRYPVLTGTYNSARRGFAATLPPLVVSQLRCEPGVRWIEEM